jgi:hypothetical protein
MNFIDKPTGGFPPILILNPELKKEIEQNKNREFSSVEMSVNIKDVLKAKSEKKPLFEI